MGRGLIVIEGLDGSGKATQAKKLSEHLTSVGENNLQITFPDYSSKSSELVKMYLGGEIGGVNDVNAYAATSFYAADRYISYKTKWEKDYLAGTTIIADRYATSNAIYQMAKLPNDKWEEYLEWTWDYEFSKLRIPVPDKVIYLDVEPEVSQRLMSQRYGGDDSKKDIHENDISYLLSCRTAAFFACKKLGWQIVNCSDKNNILTIEEIFDKICTLI